MADTKVEFAPMPYGLRSSSLVGGLRSREDSAADIAATYESLRPSREAPAASGRRAAAAYSPSQKKFFVSGPQGGVTYDADNDTAAVESLKVFDPSAPSELPPGDWQPLSDTGYAQYVESIRNPSMKKLAKKNFGIGVDNLQSLVGAGLRFAGAEETGKRIMDQQDVDLSKTMPYQRLATDIGDQDRGIMDWFVANLAQQGPNIVESAITALIGGAVGGAMGAATGPGAVVTAAGGAFAGMFGKAGVKSAMLAAAKKYAAKETLDAGEKKLLLEAAGTLAAAEDVALKTGAASVLKQMGKVGGAGLATLGSNQAMGIADIYSEPGATRTEAALGSIPYALLESSTEFLLAGRLFGDLVSGGKPLRDLGYTKKALELLRRTSVGGAVGGALEGGVEAGQEALLLAANPMVDWNSPEGVTRLLNSFAAGAGVGGPIGSIANLKGRSDPANLLNPTASAEPGSIPLDDMNTSGAATMSAPDLAGAQPLPPVNLNVPGLPPGTTATIRPEDFTGAGSPAIINPAAPPAEGVIPAPRNLRRGQAVLAEPAAPAAPIAARPSMQPASQYGAGVPLSHSGGATDTILPTSIASIPETAEPAPLPTSGVAPVAAAADAAPVAAAPELNADFYPQPAQQIDSSQYLPAAQAPVTKGAALKGKRLPVKVFKSTPAVVSRDYSAVADKLIQQPSLVPGQLELAERLAVMNKDNLAKLAKVWDAKFEPDVTTDPAAVHALIDRVVGGKPWSQSSGTTVKTKGAALKKGPATLAPKENVTKPATIQPQKTIVTETVTEPARPAASPVQAASPSKGAALKKAVTKEAKPSTTPAKGEALKAAAKTTPTEAARELPSGTKPLRLAEKPKKPPPAESIVKNVEGVPAPGNKAVAVIPVEAEKKVTGPSQDRAELNDALDTWNDSKDTEERETAAQYVISAAFFGDPNDRQAGHEARALAALDSMLLDVSREGGDAGVALDNAIVYEALTNKDAPKRKEFQALIKRRDLAHRINQKVDPGSAVLQEASDIDRLVTVIDDMLTKKGEMQDIAYRTRRSNEAKVLYNAIRKDGKDPIIHGVKASQLFKNNRLDIQKDTETGIFRLAVGMDVARDVMVAADAPTGMFSRLDGTPLTKKFAPAEVRMKAQALLAKFRFKPKMAVFKNVADLKASNPALYKRAAAARTAGDFDTTNAAGYSFGDQVILFSDFIRDERHLALTVSHETLGHFGLRAFLPQAELTQVLTSVYDADTRLAEKVDQIVADTGMDKHEVIEEYLADYAAVIDNSLLQTVWNALKNILNKLGVTFDDDHARMIINQARRYVRNGGTGGSAFSATELYDKLERMERENGTGRFSADPLEADDGANLASKMISAQGLSSSRVLSWTGHLKKYGPARTFGTANNTQKDIIRKIAGVVSSLDFKASRSEGLGQVYKLFESQHNRSRQILNKLQGITAFTHKANWGVAQKDAPTEADKQEAGELLAYATLSKLDEITVEDMDAYGSIFDENGNERPEVIKKLMKDGLVTADEFRKGLKWTHSLSEETSYPAREIDENAKYWKIYLEQRAAVNEVALDVLRANHNAMNLQNLTRFESPANMKGAGGARFTTEDANTLQEVSKQFYRLYFEGHETKRGRVELNQENVAKAKQFIEAVTRLFDPENGDKKLKDWLDGTDNTSDFQTEEFKKVIAGLNGLAKVKLREKDSNKLKQTLQNAAISQVELLNAEYHAKRTILSSYAPLKRDGKYQIRLYAVDEDDNPVTLGADFMGVLPYYREDNEKAAIDIMEELNKLYGDREYTVRDELGDAMKVRFVAEYGTAKQTADLGDVMDYANFVYILERQNISITPAERERLITGLTAQGSMARGGLKRTGNPGWRANMVRNISEHLETQAHVAAKREFRNQMDAIIDDDKKWKGDRDKLERLKKAYKAEGLTPTQRDYRKREYDTYASKYANMANVRTGGKVEIELSNGKIKELPLRGKGEEYREEAKRLLRWQSETLDITDSTEDFLSTGIGAQLKNFTVLAQLGMSVATAFINLSSLATHSPLYMAFYNPRNGFGMGMGLAKSAMGVSRALGDLKNSGFSDTTFIRKLIDEKRTHEYGLEQHEAEFLLEQTSNGTLQPAMFNALMGSARGRVHGNRVNEAIQKWMYMFSYTESLNRRVTALAAYRLELGRVQASVKVSEKEAYKLAGEAAHKAVITSQGEYSMFNRPELARGNFGQYIFMYKMFTVVTVQLLRSLPPKGKLTFLALMILASGIKGVPFAEDIMDLIDTLAQMFGIKMTSIEKEAYELFDALAPGYAPYFMRGAFDQITGSTVSSKVGMGDIIPLSGALRYGADPWNEVKQFVGPVFGATMGLGNMAQLTVKYGAESIGLKPDATSFEDILRTSPLAVMKALGDSMAYANSGAITNIRGQIVAKDVGYSTIVARLLGFYPVSATRQNDIIRLSKMGGEYAKAIKAEMVNAYVQAGIRKDANQMKHISKQVAEWNADARGTGLEIKDFQNAVKKSLAEASRSSIHRFRRSVSKQMQPHVDEFMRLQGVNLTD